MTTNTYNPQAHATARLDATLSLQGTLGSGEETSRKLDHLIATETLADAWGDLDGFLDAADRVRAALRELRAAAALLEVAIDRAPLPAVQ